MTTRLLLAAVFTAFCVAPLARADAPEAVSYQGVLTNNGVVVPDGPYQLLFKIYDNPTAGSAVYTNPVLTVQVTDGLYNVILSGSTLAAAFDGTTNRYMEVTIQSGLPGAPITLAPRHQITSTPYALRAKKAESVAVTCCDAPTFAQYWTNYGSPYQPLQSYKDASAVVHVEGLVKISDVAGLGAYASMFTLPVGHRPANVVVAPVSGCCLATTYAYFLGIVQINPNGIVQLRHIEGTPVASTDDWITLSGVTFKAAP